MSSVSVDPAIGPEGQAIQDEARSKPHPDSPHQDPVEKAQSLHSLAQQFFVDWRCNKALGILEDAIRYAREALNELPAGHEAITQYADTLVFYAQTKAITVQGPESTEEYIAAIQAAADAAPKGGPAHNYFVQRLSWAYWARFELSKSNKDLDHVIHYINGLIDAHHDLLPQTELVLGEAFHSRFSRTKATDDIEKAVGLFEKALKTPDAGELVRHVMLQKLVQYSAEALRGSDAKAGLNRLISNAKFAVAELPPSETRERIQGTLSRAETSRELLEQGPMLEKIFKEAGVKLDDKDGPKPIGKTYIPKALYDSFTIGSAEIRIIEVMPGEPDEGIVCRIRKVALAEDIQYEALSYAWSDPEKVSEIDIENHRCKVTVNLALALRRLRHRDTSRVLWVDAICINQEEYQEKSRQVGMMAEIYGRASQVLTWLGEPKSKSRDQASGTGGASSSPRPEYDLPVIEWGHEDSDLAVMRKFFTDEKTFKDWPVVGAFSVLTLLAKDSHLNSLPFFQDPRYPEFNIGVYPSELWQQSSGALIDLLTNPYWSRVWIVQEIVLGKRVRIYFGRHIIAFETVVGAARFMAKHYYGCCYQHCAANANNRWSNIFSILGSLNHIADFEKMRTACGTRDVTQLSKTLLAGIDFREATDPRDQIYGLLGLAPDQRDDDLLRPDYQLSVAQVYTRAAFKIMRDSENLQLLSLADRQCRAEDLPSWCHDFAEKAPFNPQPYAWKLFNACTATDFKVNLNAELGLEVRGHHLDAVTHVTGPRTPESLSRALFLSWVNEGFDLAEKQCGTGAVEQTMIDPQNPLVEVYGRTLIGDTFTQSDGYNRRATSDDIKLLYGWINWIGKNIPPTTRDWASREPPAKFTEIASTVLGRTQSKKLFATKDKRLGLGISTVFGQEKEVMAGDQVWLLQGSKLPVVLRPMPPANTQNTSGATTPSHGAHRQYAFVGTAYVHGIMDGEACPGPDQFTDITLVQYPGSSKSPSPANEAMRNALRMSLLLGHGNSKRHQGNPKYVSEHGKMQKEARLRQGEGEEEQGVDAESLLFPEGRTWPAAMKPIPAHRVMLAALLKNPPETEEEWEAMEEKLVQDVAERKKGSSSSSS
ncbi:hypothetical protein CLAIMM_14002 [Cladophialophora immunda]|nr:hypothetical protein CLAIMM_14002 [Cladophialophora immunda]